jgi:predicted heme/steroid binding protein
VSIYFDVKKIRELLGEKYYREQKQFTVEELANYDGSRGKPAYVAVEGIVYDVSLHPGWGGGTHFGLTAGRDLTEQFNSCHGMTEILSKLPKVGVLNAGRCISFE